MMTTLGTMIWMQGASAAQAVSDAEASSVGIGTGSELVLMGILLLALVGGVIAMVAGDRVRRAESVRRPESWGEKR